MFHRPLSSQGVNSSIFHVNFHSKIQKKQDLRVHWQGGRSCAKAHRAFAEKFELGQKF